MRHSIQPNLFAEKAGEPAVAIRMFETEGLKPDLRIGYLIDDCNVTISFDWSADPLSEIEAFGFRIVDAARRAHGDAPAEIMAAAVTMMDGMRADDAEGITNDDFAAMVNETLDRR